MSHNKPEPPPTTNDGKPIFEQVIQDIRERAEAGRAKYGTYLQAHNGRKPMIDAYQEVLDLAHYIKQEIVEREAQDDLETQLDEARAKLAELENVEPMPELAKCGTFTEKAVRKDRDEARAGLELSAQLDEAQADAATLRAALEREQRFSRMLVPSCAQLLSRQWHSHYSPNTADWDSVRIAEFLKEMVRITQEPIAATPAESLERIKAEAVRDYAAGFESSSFGDLSVKCETLSHRIESHVWDNMKVWEQRDWLITQAALLHQQWSEKWRKTIDTFNELRESDKADAFRDALTQRAIVDGIDTSLPPAAMLEAILRLTRRQAVDPAISEEAAKLQAEARIEGGRVRAVRELRGEADGLWAAAETLSCHTYFGWREAWKAASDRCHTRAAEIAKEGK